MPNKIKLVKRIQLITVRTIQAISRINIIFLTLAKSFGALSYYCFPIAIWHGSYISTVAINTGYTITVTNESHWKDHQEKNKPHKTLVDDKRSPIGLKTNTSVEDKVVTFKEGLGFILRLTARKILYAPIKIIHWKCWRESCWFPLPFNIFRTFVLFFRFPSLRALRQYLSLRIRTGYQFVFFTPSTIVFAIII